MENVANVATVWVGIAEANPIPQNPEVCRNGFRGFCGFREDTHPPVAKP